MIALQIFKHDERPLILSKVEHAESGTCAYDAYIWSGHAWNQRTHIAFGITGEAFDFAGHMREYHMGNGYTLLAEWSTRTGSPMITRPNHEMMEGEIAKAVALALGYEDAGELAEKHGYLICYTCGHLYHPDDGAYVDNHTHDWICDNCVLRSDGKTRGGILAYAQGFYARTDGKPSVNPWDNGNPEDDDLAEEWAQGWLDAHKMYSGASRELSAVEVADLPLSNWENFTEDPTKYTPSFMYAFEVHESTYKLSQQLGHLCRVVDGKYITVL